jgi:tRNA(adenine34) deaminase
MAMTETLPHDLTAMRAAMEEATMAETRGEVPIGAVLVNQQTGQIVARAGNRTREQCDPSAHAELLVIRDRCVQMGAQRIPGHDLYVTLEPCTMCAAAIAFARIDRIIFGAIDVKGGAVISGVRFFESPTCHHRPEIVGPMPDVQNACAAQLQKFFKARR